MKKSPTPLDDRQVTFAETKEFIEQLGQFHPSMPARFWMVLTRMLLKHRLTTNKAKKMTLSRKQILGVTVAEFIDERTAGAELTKIFIAFQVGLKRGRGN